jgi:hypothetical protein
MVSVRDVAGAARDYSLADGYLRRGTESGVTANELTAAAYGSHPLTSTPLTTDYSGSGRFLSRPGFLSLPERRQLEWDLMRWHELPAGLPDWLSGGRLDELSRAVGKAPGQAEIACRTMSSPGAPTRLARADLCHDGAASRLFEYTRTSAPGGFDNDELTRALLASPALREFVAGHALAFPDTLAEIAHTVHAAATARGRDVGVRPVVALAGWPASSPDLERRLQYIAGALCAFGFDAMGCHVGQLDHRPGDVYLSGRRLDVVYRFFLIEDVLGGEQIPDVLEPLVQTHEAGRVFLFAGLDTEMHGNKRALGLLSDQQHRGTSTASERPLVDPLLAWTRPLRPGDVEFGGHRVDLPDLVRTRRADSVLRPSLMHVGTGVLPGWRVTDAEWPAARDSAGGGPLVVQQRVQPAGQLADVHLDCGVFIGAEGYVGAYCAAAPTAVDVLSMAGGGKVTACFRQTRSSSCPSSPRAAAGTLWPPCCTTGCSAIRTPSSLGSVRTSSRAPIAHRPGCRWRAASTRCRRVGVPSRRAAPQAR